MQQVNIGLDILGFLMAGVILICVLYERYLSKTKANNFVAMTISIMFVLFSDAFVYAFDKDVAHPNLIYFFNTLNFVSFYLSMFFFIRYLREWIFDYSGNFKKIMIFFEILFVLQVGVVFANLFTDIIFYVDPVYGYTRGKLFILSQIYPIVVFVVSVACIYSFKGLSKVGRAFFALFPVFPLIGLFLDYIIGDMSISYLGLLFSLMMLFGYVYMNKTHQIGEQKNSLITSQIKPHFMYNTLTSIASLCDIDPQKAKEVTISFSSYLRKNLDSISVKGPISFASELEHVNAYLVIEKTRFGDRVNYEFDIKAYDFRLPALTIQPLVENAVKHGICQKKKGGTVKISSFENKNYYVIVIEDDGVGFDFSEEKKDGKVHIGLSSVRDRLNYYCRGTIHVYSKIGEGSKITISIPKSFGGGLNNEDTSL